MHPRPALNSLRTLEDGLEVLILLLYLPRLQVCTPCPIYVGLGKGFLYYSLCNTDCPGILCVDQADVKHTEIYLPLLPPPEHELTDDMPSPLGLSLPAFVVVVFASFNLPSWALPSAQCQPFHVADTHWGSL